MQNSKKLTLGGGSFEMPVRESWQVSYFSDDITRAEIRFNTGAYPVLGIKLLSLDDPKVNLKKNIEEYLLDPSLKKDAIDLNINLDEKGIASLEYEASLESGEKAKVYRKAKIIGARTVRVATLALSWMENKESEGLIKKIIIEIDSALKEISFPEGISNLDEQTNVRNRLKKIKFVSIKLWQNLNVSLPASWRYEIDRKNKNMAAKVSGYEHAMLFIEGDNFSLSRQFTNVTEYMQSLSSALKAQKDLSNVLLQSGSENTYLISCYKKQKDEEEDVYLEHYFWHFFSYYNNVFYRLNFTYVFPESKDKFLHSLPSILDNSIKCIEAKK